MLSSFALSSQRSTSSGTWCEGGGGGGGGGGADGAVALAASGCGGCGGCGCGGAAGACTGGGGGGGGGGAAGAGAGAGAGGGGASAGAEAAAAGAAGACAGCVAPASKVLISAPCTACRLVGTSASPRCLTHSYCASAADNKCTYKLQTTTARARCWTWTYTLNSTATMYMTARRVTPQTHSPAQQHCHKLYDRKKGDPHRHTPLQHRAVHTLVDSFASSACASKSSCEHQHRCQVA